MTDWEPDRPQSLFSNHPTHHLHIRCVQVRHTPFPHLVVLYFLCEGGRSHQLNVPGKMARQGGREREVKIGCVGKEWTEAAWDVPVRFFAGAFDCLNFEAMLFDEGGPGVWFLLAVLSSPGVDSQGFHAGSGIWGWVLVGVMKEWMWDSAGKRRNQNWEMSDWLFRDKRNRLPSKEGVGLPVTSNVDPKSLLSEREDRIRALRA